TPAAEYIRAHLDRVLAGSAFRGSKRSREFLRFVVERTLKGDGASLKERTLGIEIFGRNAAYDTHNDAIVRVKANEIRKRLAQYYDEVGAADPIRIEIPPGSYTPNFRVLDQILPTVEHPPTNPPSPSAGSTDVPRRFINWRIASSGLAVVLLVASVVWASSRPTVEEQFWGPMLAPGDPILFHLGETVVYQLSRRLQDAWLREHPDLLKSMSVYEIPLQQDTKIGPGDLVGLRGTYVATGDATTIANIGSLLRKYDRGYRLRFGGKLDPGEGTAPLAILIGAYSNAWAIAKTRDLRFRFGRALTDEGAIWMIQDSATGRSWRLVNVFPSGQTDIDYALITRLVDKKHGSMTMVVGGITQFGTEAAAQLISDRAGLQQITATTPAGWQDRNLQVLIETKVVDRAAVSPRVLAVHSW
ncbi:MAG TPA: hypothetical protein VEQ63_07035, partial [Bryobacteraceae bacterium]|nr:hypothetical protein [Bryobacteraceae bacterium]